MTKKIDFNWVNPVPSELVINILNAPYRSDFLAEYRFFRVDHNKHKYKNWITNNLGSTNNALIEDVIALAAKEGIVSKKIEDKCIHVLKGRYFYLTKLACLDYILIVHDWLDDNFYKKANDVAVSHTENTIVMFQANLNLCLIDLDVYAHKIADNLRNTDYPTLFYRVVNQLWLFPEVQGTVLGKIIDDILDTKKFSPEVTFELKELNRFKREV